jgi:DNA processing protein
MEAKERSGSLITADMALEQGKDIYALPGPINSQLSRGCNRLIKQGAGILLSPEDLLEELSFVCEEKVKKLTENKIALESPENLVYSCLDLYPKNLNELADLTGLTIPALMDVLVSLELQGYIREFSKNHYVRLR